MPSVPTIQNISPSHVPKILITKPYGTYLIRARRSNDDVVSSIQTHDRTREIKENYVVLSVRVDPTLYSSPVMSYRLLFTDDNPTTLLDDYSRQRKHCRKLPMLKREYLVEKTDLDWILNPKEFHDIDFETGRFGGKNNQGLSEALWQRANQDDVKIFIKRLHKKNPSSQNELNILQQLAFFPIISLYGHYSNTEYHYLVFAHGGKSLHSICPIQSTTDESQIFRIAKIAFQISNAMLYLEKKNIVHRDLTAGNVLIDQRGFIHIVDFGHAIEKKEGKNNLSRALTHDGQDRFQIRFLAPECIPNSAAYDRKQHYASFSSKSDVWAFGILIIQLMLPKPSEPYPHIKRDLDIRLHVKINREMHPKPPGCILDVYYILQQCWAYEPIHRISFLDLQSKWKILLSILS